jgi:fructosamine-3-kinase
LIPEPRALIDIGPDRSLLVMDWLDPARGDERHWEDLGHGLAELHRCSDDSYGLPEDNFIGRLPQANGQSASWVEFYYKRRLEPQVRLAKENGRWRSGWDALVETVASRLHVLVPDRPPPSLVHGDLWGGNALATVAGPAIIDPAVYYGHCEVDLAMTELFGGFASRFYSAYREANPLEDGYEDRRDLYNLYHLLNHLNHFGGGYAASVDRILRRYGT